jgi:hypothetical protein
MSGFRSHCLGVSTSFLISVPTAMSAGSAHGAEERSVHYQRDDKLVAPFVPGDMARGFPNSAARTVVFDDPHEGLCPQFTSLIYSAVNRFVFVIPMSGLSLSHAAISRSGYREIIFGTSSCRYRITIRKFLRKDGMEVEITKDEQKVEQEIKQLTESIKKSIEKYNKNLGGDNNQKDLPPFVETESNKLILRMDRLDPHNSGTAQLGSGFESEDPTPEFSGILYFAPNSATFFIVNAPNYTIDSYQDAAKRLYEINISHPKSRLSLSMQKEVLENGWTVVFGK